MSSRHLLYTLVETFRSSAIFMFLGQTEMVFFFFFPSPLVSPSCVFLARAFVLWSALQKSVSAIDISNNCNVYFRVPMCLCLPLQKYYLCIRKHSSLAPLVSGGDLGATATIFSYIMAICSYSLLPLWLLVYSFFRFRRRSRRRVLAIHCICQPSISKLYQLSLPSSRLCRYTKRLAWALIAPNQQNNEADQSRPKQRKNSSTMPELKTVNLYLHVAFGKIRKISTKVLFISPRCLDKSSFSHICQKEKLLDSKKYWYKAVWVYSTFVQPPEFYVS